MAITGAFMAILLIQTSFAGCSNAKVKVPESTPGYLISHDEALDKVFSSMTLKEKTGLLFMYAGNAEKLRKNKALLDSLEQHHVGSVCFTGGSGASIKAITNKLNNARKLSYLFGIQGAADKFIAMDGLLDVTGGEVLGSVTDAGVYTMLADIYGQILREHNLNFLLNPSFYRNQHNAGLLSRKLGNTMMYNMMKFWQAWQAQNLLAVSDVQYIAKDWEAQDFQYSKEQVKSLVDNGLGGVMENPANHNGRNNMNFVNWLDSVAYKGITFNSRLMESSGPVDSDKLVDDLLMGFDVFIGHDEIFRLKDKVYQLAKKDSSLKVLIEQKSHKVLQMIRWGKQNTGTSGSETYRINEKLSLMKEVIAEYSMVVIENKAHTLPVQKLEGTKIASVAIGNGKEQHFQKMLNRYHQVKNYTITPNATKETFLMMQSHLREFDRVIIGLHPENDKKNGFRALNSNVLDFIERMGYLNRLTLVLFTGPDYLSRLNDFSRQDAIVLTHGNDSLAQDKAAQLIFGGIMPKGQLARNIDLRLKAGSGKQIGMDNCRLGYASPELVGIQRDSLKHIQSLMEKAIKKKALPGGQIIAARHGKVFYNESFGHHTYKKSRAVAPDDIYDLASITKVAATTLSLMKMYDQEKFSLDDELSTFIPGLDTTNKDDLQFKDVLGHQSRLASWLPFYFDTYNDFRKKELRKDLFRKQPKAHYGKKVAENLYVLDTYRDSILQVIYDTRLKAFKRYKYSDLGFYLLHRAFDGMADVPMDVYADSVFYRPLGANTLTFNPLEKFDAGRIAPTENDTYFRHQQLKGYVQDRGAALLGGVSGHAGLFGSAGDLAKLMQMLLNKGEYGCRQFLHPNTVDRFTSNPFSSWRNHRGLGFDKPRGDIDKSSACPGASDKSYGHLGFSGTMVWVDPEYDLVYVFLSNRIYPTIENYKIVHMNLRQKIQQVFYDAITDPYYQHGNYIHQKSYNEQEKSL